MAQIRNTIELLSKILNQNGTSKLRAETFRLAKFNRDDHAVVSPFWNLLMELLYYCEYGKIDEVPVKAQQELSTEETVVFVKRELQQRGFQSRDFLSLPTDMNKGSRDLLLALGWLICKENIIQRFMLDCTSPLDDETSLLSQVSSDNILTSTLLPMSTSSDDARSRVQQLLWLNNKLRLNLRSLYALQREHNILKHKVHEATYGVSLSKDRNHLSVLEVYMLRHPELLKKNLQLLEKDNDRLQNLLKWKDHEESFWKWMESVLDSKLQDQQKNPHSAQMPTDSPASASSNSLSKEIVDQFQESHGNLQDAISKYESIVDQLEDMWQEKSSEISEEELDSVLASIDLELSIQRANIALNNTQSYLKSATNPPPPPDTKWCYQRPVGNRKSGPFPPSNSTQSIGSETYKDIEDEINHMHALVTQLQDEVDAKQAHFKEEMQSLSNHFRDAICVPPMASKI